MSARPAPHRIPAATTADLEKVHVSVDISNILYSMKGMQHWGGENTRDLSLGKLAEAVVAKRQRPSVLESVTGTFGVCDRSVDPYRHDREMEMVNSWRRDRRVTVKTRVLKFDKSTGTNKEKGVDNQIALGFVDAHSSGRYGAAILVTGDSDFTPVLEWALEHRGRTHTEVARWECQQGGPWVPNSGLWCHYLDRADFLRCTTSRAGR